MLHCPNAHFTTGEPGSHNVSACEPDRWCMTASAPASSRRALAQEEPCSRERRARGCRRSSVSVTSSPLMEWRRRSAGGRPLSPGWGQDGAATMKPAVLARCVRSTGRQPQSDRSASPFSAVIDPMAGSPSAATVVSKRARRAGSAAAPRNGEGEARPGLARYWELAQHGAKRAGIDIGDEALGQVQRAGIWVRSRFPTSAVASLRPSVRSVAHKGHMTRGYGRARASRAAFVVLGRGAITSTTALRRLWYAGPGRRSQPRRRRSGSPSGSGR